MVKITIIFILDYNHYFTILHNIEFIYNNIDCHWAETDGTTIWDESRNHKLYNSSQMLTWIY